MPCCPMWGVDGVTPVRPGQYSRATYFPKRVTRMRPFNRKVHCIAAHVQLAAVLQHVWHSECLQVLNFMERRAYK